MAQKYIDAVSGNDANSGDAGTPWKTLGRANTYTFVAGDKLFLLRGQTHTGTLICSEIGSAFWTESGLSGNFIEVAAYGDPSLPRPKLAVPNNGRGGGLLLVSGRYWKIHDLEVNQRGANGGNTNEEGRGIAEAGVLITGDNNEVYGLYVTGHENGIRLQGVNAHHNWVHHNEWAYNTRMTATGSGAYGAYGCHSISGAHHNEIGPGNIGHHNDAASGNTSWPRDGTGYEEFGANDNLVWGNHFYENANAVEIAGGIDTIIAYNLLRGDSWVHFSGFPSGGPYSRRVKWYNNVFAPGAGKQAVGNGGGGQAGDMIFRNCHFEMSGAQIGSNGSASSTWSVGNCSSRGSSTIGGGYTNAGGNQLGITDPKFVNAAANDFHLASGSPLIDAGAALTITSPVRGVTISADYYGTTGVPAGARDIGIHEAGGSSGGTPPPVQLRFKGDFSTGDDSQWNVKEYAPGPSPVRGVTVGDAAAGYPVIAGRTHMGKFTVAPDSIEANAPAIADGRGDNPSAQLTQTRVYVPGDERWTAFAVALEPGFGTPPSWFQVAEIFGPPWGVQLLGLHLMKADATHGGRRLAINGWRGVHWVAGEDLVDGVVRSVLLHTKHSLDAAVGFIEVYYGPPGEEVIQTLRSGNGTLVNSNTRKMMDTWSESAGSSGTYKDLKINQYRDSGWAVTKSLYHAGALVGDTRADVNWLTSTPPPPPPPSGGAPQVVGTPEIQKLNVAGTGLTFNRPSGSNTPVEGDVLLFLLDASGTSTITAPAGAVHHPTDAVQSSTRIAAYYYECDGVTDPATYAFTMSASHEHIGAMLHLRGADVNGTLFGTGVEYTGTSADVIFADITPPVDNCLLVAFGGQRNGDTSGSDSWATPTGWTERADTNTGIADADRNFFVATKEHGATAVGTVTFTGTHGFAADGAAGRLLVVRPVAGSGSDAIPPTDSTVPVNTTVHRRARRRQAWRRFENVGGFV